MPLIDLYVETAAGDQNHCALVGNFFIRTSTSVMIREKQQDLGRGTQRGPNRQTDTDKTQQKPACRIHGHAALNGKFLITHDGLQPGGRGEGLGKPPGVRRVRRGRLPAAPALARSSVRGRCGAASADSPPSRTRSFLRPACRG